MVESLELQIARSKIESYEHDYDTVTQASKEAQDCLDCEEMLSAGIAAYRWLERAETALVEGVAEGLIEATPDLDEAIRVLHTAWLRPLETAQKWIARCQKNGFEIKNFAPFVECVAGVQEWLERDAHYNLARAARLERFTEEPW